MKPSRLFNYNEPLRMPRGSVRAILATTIMVCSMAYHLIYQEFPEALILLEGTIVGFYFGARMGETSGKAKDEDLPEAV